MSIWKECDGIHHRKSLALQPWRMVEAQHISSSRDLVENREEHDLLEKLLENSKPQIANNKHYLIFTPFRYPPLEYGSRFGNTFEFSLWYGSINLHTALAEVAFYRLKFFDDTSANLDYIEIPMTAFKANIQTEHGIDLTEHPFSFYQDKISNKTSYDYSQKLGPEMREAKIEAFIFTSAREKNGGKNVAAFTPEVFKVKDKQYISNMQNWRCITNKNVIEFTRDEIMKRKQHVFLREDFEGLRGADAEVGRRARHFICLILVNNETTSEAPDLRLTQPAVEPPTHSGSDPGVSTIETNYSTHQSPTKA